MITESHLTAYAFLLVLAVTGTVNFQFQESGYQIYLFNENLSESFDATDVANHRLSVYIALSAEKQLEWKRHAGIQIWSEGSIESSL